MFAARGLARRVVFSIGASLLGCGARSAIPPAEAGGTSGSLPVRSQGGSTSAAGGTATATGAAGTAGGGVTLTGGGSGLPPCDADADGHPSIACGGDDCDDADPSVHPGAWDTNGVPGAWRTEFVFGQIPGDTRGRTSLAVDREGSAHVSEASRGLRYATNAGGSWDFTLVDEHASGTPALALSAEEEPWIAYLVQNAVWLATRERAVWSIEQAPDLPAALPAWQGGAVALAVDANGQAHLAYTAEDGKLRYAERIGTTWSVEGGFAPGETVVLGLVVDARALPHLVFAGTDGERALFYATRCAMGFCLSQVSSGTQMDADLALDATGTVHVMHGLNTLGNVLSHSMLSARGTWLKESLVPAPCWSVAIVSSPRGVEPSLHVACVPYMDRLQVAERGSNGWSYQSVGGGYGVSLALEGNSVLHLTASDFRFDVNTFVAYASNRQLSRDGVDGNCDGVDGIDRDGDGEASLLSGGTDCNDQDPAVNAAALDPVGDAMDSNCDHSDG